MKQEKKQLNETTIKRLKESAKETNTKRLKLNQKYLKQGLIFNTYYFDLFTYLLTTKKAGYSWGDISSYINRNTWETKLKPLLKKEKFILGEKKGREYFFRFNKRNFLIYLYDEFINYIYKNLAIVTSDIYSTLKEIKQLEEKQKKIHHIKSFNKELSKLSKEYIKLTGIDYKKESAESNKIFNRLEHGDIKSQETRDKLDFLNKKIKWKAFTSKEYASIIRNIKIEFKENTEKFSEAFNHFKEKYYKIIKNDRFKAFCDIFDYIISEWSNEYFIIMNEASKNADINPIKGKGKKAPSKVIDLMNYYLSKESKKSNTEILLMKASYLIDTK